MQREKNLDGIILNKKQQDREDNRKCSLMTKLQLVQAESCGPKRKKQSS